MITSEGKQDMPTENSQSYFLKTRTRLACTPKIRSRHACGCMWERPIGSGTDHRRAWSDCVVFSLAEMRYAPSPRKRSSEHAAEPSDDARSGDAQPARPREDALRAMNEGAPSPAHCRGGRIWGVLLRGDFSGVELTAGREIHLAGASGDLHINEDVAVSGPSIFSVAENLLLRTKRATVRHCLRRTAADRPIGEKPLDS